MTMAQHVHAILAACIYRWRTEVGPVSLERTAYRPGYRLRLQLVRG